MNFEYFWPNMVKVWTGYWQDIIFNGLRITLQFAAVAVLMGVLLGTIVAILKMSRSKIVRFLITVYIEVIRGTPILLQLFIFVFALPQVLPALNLTTPQWTAVALSINSSAYVSEIIRSGIQSAWTRARPRPPGVWASPPARPCFVSFCPRRCGTSCPPWAMSSS